MENENEAITPEATQTAAMSDEEFDAYINAAMEGGAADMDAAEAASLTENTQEPSAQEPSAHEPPVQDLNALRNRLYYEMRVEEIQNGWLKESEVIKKIAPDFDLETAFKNPEFYNLVVSEGKTLAEAYPALRAKPKRRTISEVGSLSGGVYANTGRDVAAMSDKEFDAYIKKIKNS